MQEKNPTPTETREDSTRLETIYAINSALKQAGSHHTEIESVLPKVLRLAMDQLNGHTGTIIVVRDELKIESAWLIRGANAQADNSPDLAVVVERGLAGWVMREKRTALVEDTSLDERWYFSATFIGQGETWSAACAPILIGDRALGAITILRQGRASMSAADVELLAFIADQAAATIEYARIHHAITRQVELKNMRQDLTVMLVHDLRNPLANVISSLELVEQSLNQGDADGTAMMLDIAMRSSQRLQLLVESLLDINRLEEGHPIVAREVVSVAELFDFAFGVMEPDLQLRNITFINDTPDDLPDVFAERNMLRRVIVNLLDNAVKHAAHGQRITVSALPVDSQPFILFTVDDQGGGIPESEREIIFEKYQRIGRDPQSSGLGLGLAFCRLAVEAHGGRIWMEDAPGGGARFAFTLPVANGQHAANE